MTHIFDSFVLDKYSKYVVCLIVFSILSPFFFPLYALGLHTDVECRHDLVLSRKNLDPWVSVPFLTL